MDRKHKLAKAVNDGSRHITVRRSGAPVPLKFDKHGKLVSKETPLEDLVIKKLSLQHFEFLSVWKENGFTSDLELICKETGLTIEQAERMIARLSCFRTEDAKIRALAKIPSKEMILAKDQENLMDPGSAFNPTISDSQHKSLDRIAKVIGVFKTSELNITQNNIFIKPNLSPEQEKLTREFFDSIAIEDANAA